MLVVDKFDMFIDQTFSVPLNSNKGRKNIFILVLKFYSQLKKNKNTKYTN